MTLSKKTYKALDALRLVFQVSPVCTALHVFLSIIQAIMPTAATALTTANFVDTATTILHGERPHDDIYMPLILLLLALGLFTTVGAVVQLVSSRININLQHKLKPALVQIHSALDFKHIENAESWELISRISRDPVKSIMDGFGAFMQFMQIVVSVTSVLILIVTQVWWAAIIIIAFSTPMFWLSMRAGKKNYQAGREAEKFNRRTEYLDEVLTGRDAVDERTLFGYGDAVNKSWWKQYEAGRILQIKVTAKMFLITKGSSMLLALIALLAALTLISPVVSGHLSAGMFMGIVGAVFGMINQLGWQMSYSLENISKVSEYMKDLTAFVGLSEAESSLSEPDTEPIEFNSLEFRNVRFKYPSGDRFILDGLSFTLKAGSHYAFVGRNGAGKTTITKLLTGLYTEYEGEILINGKELRMYPASTLKALFSVVYQDFAKYYIPLKDNIALGDVSGTKTDDKITDAVMQAGLGEMIAKLKNDIDTPLGKISEDGQDISGGQWQRVAIARSLISRAPVKMLDEPTAALDPIGESQVYSEFEKLMRGKTTVFISHRLGSTKLADEILVIDDGKIIERGPHDKLMAANGQYAMMFEAQRGWYQ
ncbi:MAG: ABC transporter ATP-binding protein/permease [Oscillospiraceae bacterium]|nr:ABC transporter ATP-binding protein/permease [Oscillospiraceae bacterium]